MVYQVKAIKGIDELASLNFDTAVDMDRLSKLPDECTNYVLTSKDKKRIVGSFDTFINAMADKTYSLLGGLYPKEEIMNELIPVRNKFEQVVENSRTFGDLATAMESMTF